MQSYSHALVATMRLAPGTCCCERSDYTAASTALSTLVVRWAKRQSLCWYGKFTTALEAYADSLSALATLTSTPPAQASRCRSLRVTVEAQPSILTVGSRSKYPSVFAGSA